MDSLPVVDLDQFRSGDSGQASLASDALIRFGALLVKDSRVTQDANDSFLDLLEDYFAQPRSALEQDLRPEWSYQRGVTLEETERPICASSSDCKDIIAALHESERPLDLTLSHSDPKCRFFYSMANQSERPDELPNVIPAAFADLWSSRMDSWGQQMKTAVEGVAEMLAEGLGLPTSTFVDLGRNGHHLLAPTATNLDKYGKLDSVFAGFHSDLNFLSIHGPSRYPGLNIWARNTGKRLLVRVPPGHLLVQAAQQLEHITGGKILAGYHEVVCNKLTLQAIERARREKPDRPCIRISSTFFWHLSPETNLAPILSGGTTTSKYPGQTVKEFMHESLKAIALDRN